MNREKAIERLEGYQQEIQNILSRFTCSSSGVSIADGDQPRLHQTVMEVHDLFDDFLGRKNNYGSTIVKAYNDGTTNFFGTSSYASTQTIIATLGAALVRIKTNPELGNPAPLKPAVVEQQPALPESRLEFPEKVTLHWMVKNVPVSIWLTALGVVVAAFLMGVSAAKLGVVQEWFSITAPLSTATRK